MKKYLSVLASMALAVIGLGENVSDAKKEVYPTLGSLFGKVPTTGSEIYIAVGPNFDLSSGNAKSLGAEEYVVGDFGFKYEGTMVFHDSMRRVATASLTLEDFRNKLLAAKQFENVPPKRVTDADLASQMRSPANWVVVRPTLVGDSMHPKDADLKERFHATDPMDRGYRLMRLWLDNNGQIPVDDGNHVKQVFLPVNPADGDHFDQFYVAFHYTLQADPAVPGDKPKSFILVHNKDLFEKRFTLTPKDMSAKKGGKDRFYDNVDRGTQTQLKLDLDMGKILFDAGQHSFVRNTEGDFSIKGAVLSTNHYDKDTTIPIAFEKDSRRPGQLRVATGVIGALYNANEEFRKQTFTPMAGLMWHKGLPSTANVPRQYSEIANNGVLLVALEDFNPITFGVPTDPSLSPNGFHYVKFSEARKETNLRAHSQLKVGKWDLRGLTMLGGTPTLSVQGDYWYNFKTTLFAPNISEGFASVKLSFPGISSGTFFAQYTSGASFGDGFSRQKGTFQFGFQGS